MNLFINSSTNNLDEIVFENRNKMYGAYELRKGYDTTLIKAFVIAVSLFVLLFAITVLSKFITPPKPVVINDFVTPFQPMTDYEIILEKETPASPPKVSLQHKTSSESFEIAIDKKVIQNQTEIKPIERSSNTGALSGTLTANQGAYTAMLPAGPVGIKNPIDLITKPDAVSFVDVMPEFPGGEEAMKNYLRSNIIIPHEAEVAQITGSVLLSFVVETDGSISSVSVERGRGYGIDEEALRVVKQMPNWKPGLQKGNKVRVKFFLPIRIDTY